MLTQKNSIKKNYNYLTCQIHWTFPPCVDLSVATYYFVVPHEALAIKKQPTEWLLVSTTKIESAIY